MATYLDLSKKILIDPSAAIAPLRYNLPPHPRELARREEHWRKIIECAKKTDIIIITHYHYDHHNPDMPEVFENKVVIIKNPKENINQSQRERASLFLHRINRLAKEILIGDGGTFKFDDVEITCSNAVCHGVGN